MGYNPSDMARSFGFIQDGCQSIDHHVEQKGEQRVPLSYPTQGREEGAYLPIDVHCGPAMGHHLHHPSHPPIIEALAE